ERKLSEGDNSASGEPDQLLICDKQRNGDWEGKISLWYHPSSRQYMEAISEQPHDLMEVLP
ncbi:hypothetical protein, partial [Escherichia coli]|uniref:hypothetical protein n=1 Tax=Escherichia coli TaxID=562 RepID=UPI003CFED029